MQLSMHIPLSLYRLLFPQNKNVFSVLSQKGNVLLHRIVILCTDTSSL